jgi:hypothetical protein
LDLIIHLKLLPAQRFVQLIVPAPLRAALRVLVVFSRDSSV